MKKIYLVVLFILALGIISLGFVTNQQSEKHPDVDWTLGCQECHAETTPEIYEDWNSSRHGTVNFGCYICHGDGQEVFYSNGTDAQCGGCHAGQLDAFDNSEFKSCFDCHNGHTLKFHND